jgi:TorA maturation chaperone TorD
MMDFDLAAARECVYRFFSLALTEPHGPDWSGLLDAGNQQLARASLEHVLDESYSQIAASLDELFGQFQQSPHDLHEECQRLFGLTPARECPPFETDYYENTEPFFRSQQMADVAGFYRAFGLNPATESPRQPDHIALEMEFMAFLLMKARLLAHDQTASEALSVCHQAENDFFREHLAWWVPAFASGMQKRAGHGIYAALGRVLEAFIEAESKHFGANQARVSLPTLTSETTEDANECGACVS